MLRGGRNDLLSDFDQVNALKKRRLQNLSDGPVGYQERIL